MEAIKLNLIMQKKYRMLKLKSIIRMKIMIFYLLEEVLLFVDSKLEYLPRIMNLLDPNYKDN